MQQIAFVTTSKGRLHHIRETLPRIVGQAPHEIIVVDYGCPDGTAAWVETHYPDVKVLRVDDDPGFCLPRARNLGARLSSARWICFIDADIRIQPGWVEWMRQRLVPGHFYRAAADAKGKRDGETFGTVICERAAFERIGGYDEAFRGWGGEDTDLYARLAAQPGLREAGYPAHFVEPIPHDDGERTQFHEVKRKDTQGRINVAYIRIKQQLLAHHVDALSIEVRRALMEQIKRQLGGNGDAAPRKTYAARVLTGQVLSRTGLPRSFVVDIARRRRFVLFGPRRFVIRVRPEPVEG
ncbi:Glycosyltransferase [Azoarcus olearius]|uniref:Glycosyltransferase n=1 Tax=Azoarcus sp. (strain BH72) TaxID=418699 RepID=A1K1E0_AZOSB|nr:Glycosyltransferase [Azoarcus olearius]